MNLSELKEKLNNYCYLLTAERAASCPSAHEKFNYSVGKKYIRIWHGSESNGEIKYKYVFCFCDFDGNIYKSDGWNKPAAGVRAHIDDAPLHERQLYKYR